MRDTMKDLCGKRLKFNGVFCKIGHRNSFYTEGNKRKFNRKLYTVLLRDLRDENGELIADHLWLDLTPPWVCVHPNFGDIVEFTGLVQNYVKGMCSNTRYYNRGTYELDYTVVGIDDIKIIGRLSESDKEEVLSHYDEQEDERINF